MTAAFGAAGSAAMAGARKMGRRSGSGGELTPWERMEAESNTAAAVHGAPQRGFDPVPGGEASVGPPRGGGAGGEGSGTVAREPSASADVAGLGEPVAVAVMSDGGGSVVESPGRRGRPPARGPAAQPDTTSVASTPTEIDVPAVPPMTKSGDPEPIPPPEHEPPPYDDEPPDIGTDGSFDSA